MPIYTAKFKEAHSAVSVTYGGETATVEYNKDAISTKKWREIRRRARQQEEGDSDEEFSIAVLCRLLVKWDVYADAAGKKLVPLTEEALDELPPAFLNAVLSAIMADMYPPEVPALSSGSFS